MLWYTCIRLAFTISGVRIILFKIFQNEKCKLTLSLILTFLMQCLGICLSLISSNNGL